MLTTVATPTLDALRAAALADTNVYFQPKRMKRRAAKDPSQWLHKRPMAAASASSGWDTPQLTPSAALKLYRDRMQELLAKDDSKRDWSEELASAKAYFCSHSHKESASATDDDETSPNLSDSVWLYLCHIHNKLYAQKLATYRDAIARHCAVSASVVPGETVLEKELRRRMLVFHLGGAQDYFSYLHPTYLKEVEEKKRVEFVKSKQTVSLDKPAFLVAELPPPSSVGDEKKSQLQDMLERATDAEIVLACCAWVTSPPPAKKAAADAAAKFVIWSGQYAWCVYTRDALTTLHQKMPAIPAAAEYAEEHARNRLLFMSQTDITESWQDLQHYFVKSFAAAGFSLRTKRLDSTKQRAGFSARAVDDMKMLLDSVKNPVVDANIHQLISTRRATPASQYLRTRNHPAHDRFAFFYFALMFKAETNVDFLLRYAYLGDCGITNALCMLTARKPTAANAPFLPIIVEFGGVIFVRMGNRSYRCKTLVESAVVWCVLVHLYYQHSLEEPTLRHTEDGRDLSGFLGKFLPPGIELGTTDTRAHMIAELNSARYPYDFSDSDATTREELMAARNRRQQSRDAFAEYRTKLMSAAPVVAAAVAAAAPRHVVSSSPSRSQSLPPPRPPPRPPPPAPPSLQRRGQKRPSPSTTPSSDSDSDGVGDNDEKQERFRTATTQRRAERQARRERSVSQRQYFSAAGFKSRRPLTASLSPP